MKNTILISGAVAAIIGLQVVSYRAGIVDGRMRESTGKCFAQMVDEMATMTAWLAKIQAK